MDFFRNGISQPLHQLMHTAAVKMDIMAAIQASLGLTAQSLTTLMQQR
jgi:hypothetical protein